MGLRHHFWYGLLRMDPPASPNPPASRRLSHVDSGLSRSSSLSSLRMAPPESARKRPGGTEADQFEELQALEEGRVGEEEHAEDDSFLPPLPRPGPVRSLNEIADGLDRLQQLLTALEEGLQSGQTAQAEEELRKELDRLTGTHTDLVEEMGDQAKAEAKDNDLPIEVGKDGSHQGEQSLGQSPVVASPDQVVRSHGLPHEQSLELSL